MQVVGGGRGEVRRDQNRPVGLAPDESGRAGGGPAGPDQNGKGRRQQETGFISGHGETPPGVRAGAGDRPAGTTARQIRAGTGDFDNEEA